MRVLIADDEPVNRLVLSRKLRQWGHEPVVAEDGAQAWAMMQSEPFRMVITDWMMPEMDGIELTRRIRLSPFGGYTYVLLLTARAGVEALVEGIEAGADDFVTKPFQMEELRARLRAGERVLQLESDLAEHNRRLTRAYASARRDLEAAAEMQKALLPPQGLALPGVATAWRFLPASLVAGDVFNVHALDETRTAFYLLDVAGHGVPSAMLSFTLSKLLVPRADADGLVKRAIDHAPYWEVTPPAELVRELNRRFQDDSDALKYFTMIYGIVDSANDTVMLAQAGHPTPLLVRRSGAVERIGDSGFPVGMLPDVDYEQHAFTFEPGDRLFLYSDGVTECADDARAAFGLQRLEDVVARADLAGVEAPVDAVERALRQWRATEDFADDVTLLALEREGGMSGMHPLPEGNARLVRLGIDSRLDHVELLARAVRALCATAGLPARECARVELALVEAVNNVIRHAYHGEAGHPVEVEFSVSHGVFTILIADQGEPMPERTSPVLDFDPGDVAGLPEGGMGLFIIHSVMDHVEFRREAGRNAIVMTRRLAA